MPRSLLIVACCLLGLGCKEGQNLPAEDLTVDGTPRQFRIFVPEVPPEDPMPLVLAFHGGGGRDFTFPQEAEFEALAESEGFVLAFPLAEQLPQNEGEWQLNTGADSRQDLDFVEALIDHLAAEHALDTGRVYALGYSLGSMFTYELACHLSDRFAAIASHAGTMPMAPDRCDPAAPASILHVHGDDDGIIPYSESWDWKEWDSVGTMLAVPDLVQFWADQHACQDVEESDAGASTHTVHSNCSADTRVEHHRIDGGDHGWPDTLGGESTPRALWTFLSGFSIP